MYNRIATYIKQREKSNFALLILKTSWQAKEGEDDLKKRAIDSATDKIDVAPAVVPDEMRELTPPSPPTPAKNSSSPTLGDFAKRMANDAQTLYNQIKSSLRTLKMLDFNEKILEIVSESSTLSVNLLKLSTSFSLASNSRSATA